MFTLPELDIPLPSVSNVPSNLPIKKLLKHLSGNDYILEIDNTSLESFLACDRAAEYRLVHSRTTHRSAAIVYGSAVHRGLEELYHNRGLNVAKYEASKILAEQPSHEMEWRNQEALDNTLEKYVKEYPQEGFEIVKIDSQPCIEQAFSVQLGMIPVNGFLAFNADTLVVEPDLSIGTADPLYVANLHIVWTGVMDLIVQEHGGKFIVDHKTSSVLGQSYFDAFNLSQQFIGYTYAAQKILNEPIAGAILNVLAGRKPTKTGVSLEFHRLHYRYTDEQREEWVIDIMTLVADFVDRLQTGYFPKKTLWCTGKFGTCPYMAVCQSPKEQRMLMLHTDAYADNTWNPLNKQ